MQRLRNSAGMLQLSVPLADEELKRRCRDTMDAAGLGRGPENEAYIRILLTRGIGELSYDPGACPVPSVIVIVKRQVDPPAEAYEQGIRLALVSVVRNHPGSVNPLIKSNNLLNNALAMQEAARRGAFEGITRNFRGELAECTTSNLSRSRRRRADAPDRSGLLPGITRACSRLARKPNRRPRSGPARRPDEADEVFITSTTRGVVPATTFTASETARLVPSRALGAAQESARHRQLTPLFDARCLRAPWA